LSHHHHHIPSLARSARQRGLSLHHHIPSLARNARRRGLPPLHHLHTPSLARGCFSNHPPYPYPRSKHETEGVAPLHHLPTPSRSKRETEGVVSSPPPYSLHRSKCETEGVFSLQDHHLYTPSLARNARRRGLFPFHHHHHLAPYRGSATATTLHSSLTSNVKWRTTNLPSLQMRDERFLHCPPPSTPTTPPLLPFAP